MFRLNLKRTDTITTESRKKENETKEGKSERRKVKQKKKNGSVFAGLRFQRQSRPMDVSEHKEGDEGGIERDTERGIEREGKAERETLFSMKRTAGRTVRPLSMWPG